MVTHVLSTPMRYVPMNTVVSMSTRIAASPLATSGPTTVKSSPALGRRIISRIIAGASAASPDLASVHSSG